MHEEDNVQHILAIIIHHPRVAKLDRLSFVLHIKSAVVLEGSRHMSNHGQLLPTH